MATDKDMVMVVQSKVYQGFVFVVCTYKESKSDRYHVPNAHKSTTEISLTSWVILEAPYKSVLLAMFNKFLASGKIQRGFMTS